MRVEDIDTPRILAGSIERQLDDLRWLGLDWDEGPDRGGDVGPYAQSERFAAYEEALSHLADLGRLYFCDCSRAEIARVASAPHAGEEGPRYPGMCRTHGLAQREWKRPPAVRVRMDGGEVSFVDRFLGRRRQDVAQVVGDFVLKRGDGIYSYQLAVVVDDLAMRVTEVVRGADLLGSAPRQIALARLLGGTPPQFAHTPLVLGADGARLAKRARGVVLRDHREAGRDPEEVVALLARILGLIAPGDDRPRLRPRDVLAEPWEQRLLGRAEVRLPDGVGDG